MKAWLYWILFLVLKGGSPSPPLQPSPSLPEWSQQLWSQVAEIDQETSGSLGVYVKQLSDGSVMSYQADRPWYLASTVKVPIAIAVLQEVEAGHLDLDQMWKLRTSDFVDGSGEVLWKQPGSSLPVRYLLEKMLTQSDSTAADILIQMIGPKTLNQRIQAFAGHEFGQITSLIQVRYLAFQELHPSVLNLSNMDLIEIRREKDENEQLKKVLLKLDLKPSDLQAKSIEEAFESYYEKGLNSAPLDTYGNLLENLTQGRLLSPEHTSLVLNLMEHSVTGEKRIKAGLPLQARFAQKTGTQLRRICNVGLIRPLTNDLTGIVVAACLEKFESKQEAESTLARVGEALSSTLPHP